MIKMRSVWTVISVLCDAKMASASLFAQRRNRDKLLATFAARQPIPLETARILTGAAFKSL